MAAAAAMGATLPAEAAASPAAAAEEAACGAEAAASLLASLSLSAAAPQPPVPAAVVEPAAFEVAALTAAPPAAAPADPTTQSQWASTVVAFSSQFSASDNAAVQLLGPTHVFPAGGHSPQAWSAVPRPGGGGKEWVRLSFGKPMWASELHVFETANPGSLSRIRFASEAAGQHAADSEWVEVWRAQDGLGPATRAGNGGAAGESGGEFRMLSPKLNAAALELPVKLVELELDTSQWGEEYWSEYDAVRLVGWPVDPSDLNPQLTSPFLQRLPWEGARQYDARARFVQRSLPAAPPGDAVAEMRQAALSMVWVNHKALGCRYPEAVEQQVGLTATKASLLGIEGDLRAAEAAAAAQ